MDDFDSSLFCFDAVCLDDLGTFLEEALEEEDG